MQGMTLDALRKGVRLERQWIVILMAGDFQEEALGTMAALALDIGIRNVYDDCREILQALKDL